MSSWQYAIGARAATGWGREVISMDQRLPIWPAVPYSFLPEFVGASGAYLLRADGRRVLDAAGQACVSNIGYGRREVADAIHEAVLSFTHALPPLATPQRLELVDRLRRHWLPPSLSRIHLVNSGSEAAETAIKLARQYHVHRGDARRWKVIGRRSSYHGVTLGALSASGHTGRRRGFEPLLHEFPLAPACYPLRCNACAAVRRCTLSCAAGVEAAIVAAGPETVSAFIAEPIVGTSGGALVPAEGYWPQVQEICRRHGVLLIIDEVITGFGRTGRRLGIDHFGIEPDIMTAAKGLTGGYAPLGAVIATDAVIEPLLKAGADIMFHTFGGHPPTCAAANAVVAILEREQLVERAADYGARLGQKLRELLGEHPHVAEIRGRGMLWAVELVASRETLQPFPASRHLTIEIVKAGIERGVFFYPGGTGEHGDVIVLGPAFIIDDHDIELMATVLLDSIDAALAGGQ